MTIVKPHVCVCAVCWNTVCCQIYINKKQVFISQSVLSFLTWFHERWSVQKRCSSRIWMSRNKSFFLFFLIQIPSSITDDTNKTPRNPFKTRKGSHYCDGNYSYQFNQEMRLVFAVHVWQQWESHGKRTCPQKETGFLVRLWCRSSKLF